MSKEERASGREDYRRVNMNMACLLARLITEWELERQRFEQAKVDIELKLVINMIDKLC